MTPALRVLEARLKRSLTTALELSIFGREWREYGRSCEVDKERQLTLNYWLVLQLASRFLAFLSIMASAIRDRRPSQAMRPTRSPLADDEGGTVRPAA